MGWATQLYTYKRWCAYSIGRITGIDFSLRGYTIADNVAMQNVSPPRSNLDFKFIFLAVYFVIYYLENVIQNNLMLKL